MELDVDLLVPAALGGVITPENASRIRAPVIVEVANGPVVGDADPILEERGIRVVPDVLANAGGVIVSYFEWVQNRQGYPWSLDQVRARLAEVLERAFADMWSVHEAEQASLRSATYAVALRRLATAVETQGTQAWFGDGDP